MRQLLIIIAIILAGGLIFNNALEKADFFNYPKDKLTVNLANLSNSLSDWLYSIFEAKTIIQENKRLFAENQNLYVQINNLNFLKEENKRLKEILELEEKTDYSYYFTYVLSSSPFNIQNLLIIDAGKNQKIEPRMPVLWGKDILIGYIKETSSKSSEVLTIFDSNMKLPVWIGNERIPAILQGGSRPFLDLIAKDASLELEESIYTNGNFFIGKIEEFKKEPSGAFKQAFIKLPYRPSMIRDVLVVTNYFF